MLEPRETTKDIEDGEISQMAVRGIEISDSEDILEVGVPRSKDNLPLCRDWQGGRCVGEKGNLCSQRHYYLDKDSTQPQAPRSPMNPEPPLHFSSPYKLKVVTEVAKYIREEVNLDTGERRKWVEEQKYHVMDLTGNMSPPLSPRKPLDSSSSTHLVTNENLMLSPVKEASNSATVAGGREETILAETCGDDSLALGDSIVIEDIIMEEELRDQAKSGTKVIEVFEQNKKKGIRHQKICSRDTINPRSCRVNIRRMNLVEKQEASSGEFSGNVASFQVSRSARNETARCRQWVPEGVDLEFLDALPEDLRKEVLEQQWRLVREGRDG